MLPYDKSLSQDLAWLPWTLPHAPGAQGTHPVALLWGLDKRRGLAEGCLTCGPYLTHQAHRSVAIECPFSPKPRPMLCLTTSWERRLWGHMDLDSSPNLNTYEWYDFRGDI